MWVEIWCKDILSASYKYITRAENILGFQEKNGEAWMMVKDCSDKGFGVERLDLEKNSVEDVIGRMGEGKQIS